MIFLEFPSSRSTRAQSQDLPRSLHKAPYRVEAFGFGMMMNDLDGLAGYL